MDSISLFRWTRLNNAFVKVSGHLCTQQTRALTPKSKEPVVGASCSNFSAFGSKKPLTDFQTRFSFRQSPVEWQRNWLLQATICMLYWVRFQALAKNSDHTNIFNMTLLEKYMSNYGLCLFFLPGSVSPQVSVRPLFRRWPNL